MKTCTKSTCYNGGSMKKVITYGTFDLLHYGHINLLTRAKALGDYLIVAVTSESFDKQRGKVNVQQSLIDRIDAVRSLGIADEVIVEEYEGQKINDIIKHNVDIFTVGSDWVGKFDYLNQYCKVVYLDRTEGVSSTSIRSSAHPLKVCLVCDSSDLADNTSDFQSINGVVLTHSLVDFETKKLSEFISFLIDVDAVFISSQNSNIAQLVKAALMAGRHVFCEGLATLDEKEYDEIIALAKQNGCVFIQGNKTFYSTAFNRMSLLVKSGAIGDVLTLDASIVYAKNNQSMQSFSQALATILMPVFQLIGQDFSNLTIKKIARGIDVYLQFPKCCANLKIYEDIAALEQLILTGSNAYLNIPSTWWKTDNFEICTKNELMNRKFFYKYVAGSIQPEILAFSKTISGSGFMNMSESMNKCIVETINKIKDAIKDN